MEFMFSRDPFFRSVKTLKLNKFSRYIRSVYQLCKKTQIIGWINKIVQYGAGFQNRPLQPRLNHRISQGMKLLLGEGHPMLDPSNFISKKLIKPFSSVTTDIMPALHVLPEFDLLLLERQPVSNIETIRNIIRFFINNYKIYLSHILQQMARLFSCLKGNQPR